MGARQCRRNPRGAGAVRHRPRRRRSGLACDGGLRMTEADLDLAPVAPRGALGGVPLIDLSGPRETAVAAIAEACRDWGFFQVVGHGDAGGEMARAFAPAHPSYLRLNFYPLGDPLAAETGSAADLGVHHHTDAGALTVLVQDGVSGLQVHHDGCWHDVEPRADAFTINIGDMVQVWSNDGYRAPPHRVLAMERAERISIPFFYNPAYSADIRPLVGTPHYRPLNWGEFRRRRADGDFADYGTEVQISDWRIEAA